MRAAAAGVLLASAFAGRAWAQDRGPEVAAWLTGTFSGRDPAADGEEVRIVVVAVPKSRIANGALVIYREQAVSAKPGEPSLQRFYRVEEEAGVVRLRAFDPKDPLIVRGKWRDPSTLALYGANDVREKPGCTLVLRKRGDVWEGGTAESQVACPSTRRSAVRMTSSLVLSGDAAVFWDRGFDEHGKQMWGSLEGGTRFGKRSTGAPTDDSFQERTGGRREERIIEKEKEREREREKDSLNVNAAGSAAPAVPSALEVLRPPSPSKKYDLAELRGMAGNAALALSSLFSDRHVSASSIVVVTSRTGVVSVFSSAEVFSSSEAPGLDVSSSAPRLVASGGRGIDDVVSIELRSLAPPKP